VCSHHHSQVLLNIDVCEKKIVRSATTSFEDGTAITLPRKLNVIDIPEDSIEEALEFNTSLISSSDVIAKV
jgi:hypothetical protein